MLSTVDPHVRLNTVSYNHYCVIYLDDPVCHLGEISILPGLTQSFDAGPGEVLQVIFGISNAVAQLTNRLWNINGPN